MQSGRPQIGSQPVRILTIGRLIGPEKTDDAVMAFKAVFHFEKYNPIVEGA
jgi:hypothetical protein